MKKVFFYLITLITTSLCFAQVLPTGQKTVIREKKEIDGKIIAAVVVTPVVFQTSIGNIESTINTRIDFYESGAVKSFYSDDVFDVKTKNGTIKVTSFHSSRKENAVPFEFYENGNLKSAFISRSGSAFLDTSIGKLQAMTATKVSFYENGEVESFKVYPNQKINVDGIVGTFVQNSILSFYENGKVKTLTSTAENKFVPLNIKIKKSKEISFSENGNIISFTPSDNSFFENNEIMYILCNGKTFELFDNGMIKNYTIDCTSQNFGSGKTKFIYGLVTNELPDTQSLNCYATFDHYDSGALKSVKAAKLGTYSKAFPIVCNIDEKFYSAKEIQYHDNGNIASILYLKPLRIGKRLRHDFYADARTLKDYYDLDLNEVPNVKITKAYTTYEVLKSYISKDGSTQYLIGLEVTESPQNSMYDTSNFGIYIVKNNTIIKSIHDDINVDTEFQFDENGFLIIE